METPPRHADGGRPASFSTYDNPPSLWPSFMTGQADRPVGVVVVDDDPHMRRVIANELMADPRTVLVAQGGSVREGKRLVREHEFDVLMVDLNLGDGSGYELIAYARNVRSATEVVAVSVLEADEDAMRAFELGAVGFLVKNSWFGSFVQAVLQVANGGASLTPSLARRLLLKLERNKEHGDAPYYPSRGKLSEREREILRMIANGLTSSEIGARLSISKLTVNTHVKHIYHKLHVRTRAQAVSCASTWGVL
jgi:DNA-binding NarL/FixJ family response regulator